MTLLISNSFDPTTQYVCQWLFYLKKQYVLLTDKSELSDVVITNQNISFTKNNVVYNLIDFQNIWYRRGDFLYQNKAEQKLNFLKEKINLEFKKINDYIFNKLEVNELYYKDINKLKILDLAISIGLNVPKFLITNSKKHVQKFFNDSKIITKPVDEVVFYLDDKYSYNSFTDEIDVNLLNEVFELSFFQQKIIKKYEIRSFVLDNEVFSIAIFSQKNIKTSVDYRRYDYKNPNRSVNYKLDKEIEKKVLKMMNTLNLKTGSFDFMVDNNNTLHFLEINPIGQFGNVSFHGNYNCEFKIAEKL